MARPTQQLRAAAAVLLLLVVVVAVAIPATATTGARRRVPVPVPPPPPPPALADFTVHCTEAYGVKAGETCRSVARVFRIPLPRFMELNQNVTCGALFPGQWVCLRGVEVA
ncbi:hypothetical protein BDA96_09G199300 [Sorghum bicolor]|uniref:LysM domain-containing protein n=2 Tax=Sorghum bicolor TaxID=4558 RepID=A0A921QBK6_SORBI|nr:hypothetical protein BDA96_09G199300 [Sorghum bicolor]KXG22290.1 hypothetical protein SORBI_3009G188600 [Sorghum bicolor]